MDSDFSSSSTHNITHRRIGRGHKRSWHVRWWCYVRHQIPVSPALTPPRPLGFSTTRFNIYILRQWTLVSLAPLVPKGRECCWHKSGRTGCRKVGWLNYLDSKVRKERTRIQLLSVGFNKDQKSDIQTSTSTVMGCLLPVFSH